MSTDKRKRRRYELKARAERQRQTRDRIVDATVRLHASRGPARTTIADIARLAGVQRLTVYNTFATPRALFGACQARFLGTNPPPDLALRPDLPPLDALEAALGRLYAWYRANAAMERHVYRDRHLVAELDALMTETADVRFAALSESYARAIAGRAAALALRALVRLALRFETWDVVSAEGLTDPQIARVMVRAIAGISGGASRRGGRRA